MKPLDYAAIIEGADVLRMDYINSLPQPFFVRLIGDKTFNWPVHDFATDVGLFRIDVCGLLEVKSMSDAAEFRDAEGTIHDAETFYSDYEAPSESPTDVGATP